MGKFVDRSDAECVTMFNLFFNNELIQPDLFLADQKRDRPK